LIEALAVGTNVLVSDRGAAREIVDDSGVGFLFDIDDAENLAEKARLIQTSHGNGTLNGFDAAKFLATRSESSYVEQLLEAYRNSSKARQQAA
jgi:glycosyltransferase involved in cell wall biosynthesis